MYVFSSDSVDLWKLTEQLSRISLGISHTDGTLHLGFDQHDDDLHYRISKTGIATNPLNATWSADIFGPVTVCSNTATVLMSSSFILEYHRTSYQVSNR